jgi:hypothetical protein
MAGAVRRSLSSVQVPPLRPRLGAFLNHRGRSFDITASVFCALFRLLSFASIDSVDRATMAQPVVQTIHRDPALL